jgi:hypothetical protein
MTSEERMKILKMIDDGKITAEEGARLLSTLSESRKASRPGYAGTRPGYAGTRRASLQGAPGSPRWLKIRVTDMISGKAKATVNLPLGLLDAGLNIASKYAPDIAFGELIEAINEGAEGKIIDVVDEEDDEHVEIFIE